jgi:hypothetical protein
MTVNRKAIVFGVAALVACAAVFKWDAVPGIRNAKSAERTEQSQEHLTADHDKRSADLRKAMPGSVDIYFDIAQVEAEKPMIANAKFVDLVDVTGKDLIRFADSKGHQWLIDPDTVLTFRMRTK